MPTSLEQCTDSRAPWPASEDRSMRSLVSETLNDLFSKRQLPLIT